MTVNCDGKKFYNIGLACQTLNPKVIYSSILTLGKVGTVVIYHVIFITLDLGYHFHKLSYNFLKIIFR